MKNILKLASLLVLGVSATVLTASAAEPAPTIPSAAPASSPRQRIDALREQRLKRLDDNLSLTADQKAKINAIWDKTENEALATRDDAAATKAGHRAKQRRAAQAMRQEVRGVLTPDQQKKFDALPPERLGGAEASGARAHPGK